MSECSTHGPFSEDVCPECVRERNKRQKELDYEQEIKGKS